MTRDVELDSREVAIYLISLFKRVYPGIQEIYAVDRAGWEIIIKSSGIIGVVAAFTSANCPRWWIADSCRSTIDLLDEESIITLIKRMKL